MTRCNSDHGTTEVSVVVLTYNSTWKELRTTLKSIIAQEECAFEVIIADDGSDNNLEKEIIDFFTQNNFSNYQLILNKTNVGTVKNLLNALKCCNSDCIKDLGQGDALYDTHTLKKMYEYMKIGGQEMIFGMAAPFSTNEQGFCVEPINNSRASISNTEADLKKCCFLYGEYPYGAALFFDKAMMIKYLEEIKEVVVYCEDISIRLMLLDDVKIQFFDDYVVFYECNNGVSHSKSGLSRVERDNISFEKYFQKSDRENQASKHIKHLSSLRLRKKLSRSSIERAFLKLIIGIVDIRIPINKVVRKVTGKKPNNPDYAMLYECYAER